MSTLAIFIQHSFGSPSHGNQRRKRKGIQIGNEEVKLSLFAEDTILYIENSEDATRKLLKLINECGTVGGYITNMQKYSEFLYTNNKRSEREINDQISFTITSKGIKYLGINVP